MNFFYLYRDALIASILDGVRASGNRDVCVKMHKTPRGYRLGLYNVRMHSHFSAIEFLYSFFALFLDDNILNR